MYSFAYLIPFISAYILWQDRKRIFSAPFEPRYFIGYLFLVSGVLILLIGNSGNLAILQELSMLLTITGLVILIFGIAILKRIWFIIAYLLFMIPVWEIITNRLHPHFQMFSATIGVKLMHLIGIPAHQSGIFIELPNIILKVAKVCSGVNYLIAIIALGIPMSYLYLRSWWKRIVIVSSAVIIAVFFNSVRVAMVGYFAFNGGEVHGPYDLFRTLIISAVGFLVLFAGIWFFGDEVEEEGTIKPDEQVNSESEGEPSLSLKYIVSLAPAILIMVGAGIFVHVYHPKSIRLETPLKEFPLTVGSWEGKDVPPMMEKLKEIPFDDLVSRQYTGIESSEISLFMGYFEKQVQSQGKELVNFRTEQIFSRGKKVIFKLNGGEEIRARYYLGEKDGGKVLVLYWCDINGRSAADEMSVTLRTIYESIFRRRKNGALIIISKEFKGKIGEKISVREIEKSLTDFYPHIREQLKTI